MELYWNQFSIEWMDGKIVHEMGPIDVYIWKHIQIKWHLIHGGLVAPYMVLLNCVVIGLDNQCWLIAKRTPRREIHWIVNPNTAVSFLKNSLNISSTKYWPFCSSPNLSNTKISTYDYPRRLYCELHILVNISKMVTDWYTTPMHVWGKLLSLSSMKMLCWCKYNEL